MAIDTREKRQSVVGIGFYFSGPSVTPNASPDAEWRQEVGWGYPGIAAGAPVVELNFLSAGHGAQGGAIGDPYYGTLPQFVLLTTKRRAAGGLRPRRRKKVRVR